METRPHVIAVSNHKGGVGKTTSTLNLGAALARAGRTVLLVDLDPQANLTQSTHAHASERTIYGAFRGEHPAPVVPITAGLELVPSHLDLSGIELEIGSQPGREYALRDLLEEVWGGYDFVLIDCPPSLGLLTVNAFTAAAEVLVPLTPEFLAVQGIAKLEEVTGLVRKRLNPRLKIGAVLLTQYDSRKTLHRDMAEAVRAHFGPVVLEAVIRPNVALAEAPALGLDVFRHAPSSHGAEDYTRAAAELLERITGRTSEGIDEGAA